MASQTTFIKQGSIVEHIAAVAITRGDIVVSGNLVGISQNDAAIGEIASLATEGIFSVPKDNSDITAIGTALYWDADGDPVGGTAGTGGVSTGADSGANKRIGWNLETAGTGIGTVKIKLDPVGG